MKLNLLVLISFSFGALARGRVLDVELPAVKTPPRILDPHLGSLSVESCYIVDFFGTADNRNELSWNLLSNFVGDFGGLNPFLRLGGHTQDHADFDVDQETPLVNFFEGDNDEAVNVTYGPSLFKQVMLDNIPENTQFIFGLNFKTLNVTVAVETAQAAWGAFTKYGQSKRLRMAVGNEPDQWGWSAESYTLNMKRFLDTLQKEINLPKKWFQAGDLANPPIPQLVYQNYTNNFRPPRLLNLGLADTNNVWTMSQHFYPFSMCSNATALNATLPRLLNYTDLTHVMTMFEGDIAKVNAAGYDYVLGETGSVSCHGRQDVSNTFGAALYMLNFMLHGASIGIRRMFMHNGTPFFYSLWQPVESKIGKPTVNPTYGSFLFLSQILGPAKAAWHRVDTGSRIAEIESLKTDDFSAFAIYSAQLHQGNSMELKALVFIDSTVWSPPSRRSSRMLNLTGVVGSGSQPMLVKRFTSSAGVKAVSTDWHIAGVRVDKNSGKLTGKLSPEHAKGMVSIRSAEAVVVEL